MLILLKIRVFFHRRSFYLNRSSLLLHIRHFMHLCHFLHRDHFWLGDLFFAQGFVHRVFYFAQGFVHRVFYFAQVLTFLCCFLAYHCTGYCHLMISSSKFFVLGADPASPYNLHIYKVTFSSTSVDWANQLACSSGTWASYFSESVLSSDGSKVYSFFIFGVTKYLYFAGFSVSDGSVATTRFKSSISVPDLYGSALNGDYVINFKFNNAY